MRSIRGFALALLTVLAALPARAAPLEDPATNLRLEPDAAGAQVCRIIPPPDRAGAAACDGIDVEAVATKLRNAGHDVAAVALLRYPAWAALVMVKGLPRLKMVHRETFEDFMTGVRRSLPAPGSVRGESSAGAQYDVIKVNGVDALRMFVAMNVPETHPGYSTSVLRQYVFTSRTGSTIVSFAASPEHTAELTAAADAVVATVSMPNAGVKNFGRSRYEMIGEAIADLIAALIPVVGIVVFFINRHRQRKKAA